MTDTELAEMWIRYEQKEHQSEKDPDFAAFDALMDLLLDEPEHLYRIVELIATQTDDQKVLANLGAGPIEDLLHNYGPQFVDRILDNARRDAHWRFALGCVWMSSAPDHAVRERVEAAITKYFPNGTP